MVAQDITGADDHGSGVINGLAVEKSQHIARAAPERKGKSVFITVLIVSPAYIGLMFGKMN
jgi:hypothetical protein